MKEALKEAKKAYAKNEIPVGAVIVLGDKVIARGHNLKESKNDPTAHAEIIAIRKAANKIGWRLNKCVMFVTLEPCAMCTGAILEARLKMVVYGAKDSKAGCMGSACSFFKEFREELIVKASILEKECKDLLQSFFKNLRQK